MSAVDFAKRPMRAITPVDKLLRASADALDDANSDPRKLDRLKVTTMMEISVILAEMQAGLQSGREAESRRAKEFTSCADQMVQKHERELALMTASICDALHSVARSVNALERTDGIWHKEILEFSKMGFWRAYRFGRKKQWSRRLVLGLILMSR